MATDLKVRISSCIAGACRPLRFQSRPKFDVPPVRAVSKRRPTDERARELPCHRHLRGGHPKPAALRHLACHWTENATFSEGARKPRLSSPRLATSTL